MSLYHISKYMSSIIFIACIIIILIIVSCVSINILMIHDPTVKPAPCPKMNQQEKEEARRLHRYHGCLTSRKIGNRWYFYRNGELCELWNPYDR